MRLRPFFAVLVFQIFYSPSAMAQFSDGRFLSRLENLNKKVGRELCDCIKIWEEIRKIKKAFATLPGPLIPDAQKAMDRLIFKAPNFRPCFEGSWKLGPDCGVCTKDTGNSALVIMDMQDYFMKVSGAIDIPANQKLANRAIEEQVKAIEKAKANGIPIMLVEYDIPRKIPLFIDDKWRVKYRNTNTDSRITAAIKGYDKAKVIQKNTDGFLDPENKSTRQVVDFFRENEIQKLIIAGANAGACVGESIVQALNGRCEVVAYTSALIEFSFPQGFIYPWAGKYEKRKLERNCSDCTFSEVHHLRALEKEMRWSPPSRSQREELNTDK